MSNTSYESSSNGTVAKVQASRSPGKLLQVLGVWFGIAVAVGNAIAAGIVRTPGDIAKLLPNAWIFMGVWVVGGLYALLGASSLAELGASIPRSGGQYNFSRRAIGEYAGFIVGWSDWLSTCGTSAAVGIVIAEYSGYFFPTLLPHIKITAVAIISVFALLQWRGIRWGSSAQLITAVMKSVAFVILVLACFLRGAHAATTVQAVSSSALVLPVGLSLAVAVMLGLQSVFYTIDGWDGVVYVAGEVRNPGRDIPRAIFGSVFSVMGIYLLLNAAVLYVLPVSEIAGNNFALGTVASRIFGQFGDPIIRSIMIVSMLSCINANHIFGSRTLHAMASDGLFFPAFAKVNAGGTPSPALLLSTLVAVGFVLGSFEQIIAMLSFFFVANYTLSYTSVFLLRRREPAMPRPYLAWGYPWTTGIVLVVSVAFLVGSILTDRENAPRALLMLVLSYPVFRLLKWASNKTESLATKS